MRRLGVLTVLVLLSACASGVPGASPSPSDSRFGTTEPMPSMSAPSGTPASVSAARMEAIRQDLTVRGVDTGQLAVVSAESVTFNDGSLGCPQPGVQYTQAQVNGMRVVVQAGGRTYDYRFGASDTPMLCEQPGPRATESTR